MFNEPTLPVALQRLLGDEISPGERLRWVGRPQPQSRLGWLFIPVMLFAVPWTAFSLTWIAGAAGAFGNGGGAPRPERFIFAMVGVPFLLAGAALMVCPFWIRRRILDAAESTLYVVTDRRVIVFNGGYF